MFCLTEVRRSNTLGKTTYSQLIWYLSGKTFINRSYFKKYLKSWSNVMKNVKPLLEAFANDIACFLSWFTKSTFLLHYQLSFKEIDESAKNHVESSYFLLKTLTSINLFCRWLKLGIGSWMRSWKKQSLWHNYFSFMKNPLLIWTF